MDAVNLAKTKFVSSWTSSVRESIPMWREYAGLGDGVRIQLPVNPFGAYDWDPLDAARVAGLNGVDVVGRGVLLPFEEFWNRDYLVHEAVTGGKLLHKVEYTDNKECLFPFILNGDPDGSFSAATSLIGVTKAKVWSYQEEWRYMITVYPVSFKELFKDFEQVTRKLRGFSFDRSDVPLPRYYDLRLSNKALNAMKIIASPGMTAGNRLILSALLDKYSPGAMIAESQLELA